MNTKQIAGMAMALGVLAGCGGGGGGDAKTGTGGNGPTVLNSGIYLDASNDLALALLPDQSGSRPWYGLRVVNPTTALPVIYRGDVDASSLSGASRSFVGSAAVNTGTAAMTAVNSARLTGRLTISNTDSPPRDIAADQVRALTAGEMAVAWSGTWTINGSSALSETVTITAPISAGNLAVSSFLNCTVTVSGLAGQSGADGVYNIGLAFANASGVTCPISGSRTGVLMAYASGSSKYLRLVAFDAGNTQSVSFRAVLP